MIKVAHPFEVLGLLPALASKLSPHQLSTAAKAVGKELHRTFHPDSPGGGDRERFDEVSKALLAIEKKGIDVLLRDYAYSAQNADELKRMEGELLMLNAQYRGLSNIDEKTLDASDKVEGPRASLELLGRGLYAQRGPGGQEGSFIFIRQAPGMTFSLLGMDKIAEIREISDRMRELDWEIDRLKPYTERIQVLQKKLAGSRRDLSTLKRKGLKEPHEALTEAKSEINKWKAQIAEASEDGKKIAELRLIKSGMNKRIQRLEAETINLKIDGECCFEMGGKRMRAIGSMRNHEPHVYFKDAVMDFQEGEYLIGYNAEGRSVQVGRIKAMRGFRRLDNRWPENKNGSSDLALSSSGNKMNPLYRLGISPQLAHSLSNEALSGVVRVLSKTLLRAMHPDTGGNARMYREIAAALNELKEEGKLAEWKAKYSEKDLGAEQREGLERNIAAAKARIAGMQERIYRTMERGSLRVSIGTDYRENFEALRLSLLPEPPKMKKGSVLLHHSRGHEVVLRTRDGVRKFTFEMEGLDVLLVDKVRNERKWVIGAIYGEDERVGQIMEFCSRYGEGIKKAFSHAMPVISPGAKLIVVDGDSPAEFGEVVSVKNPLVEKMKAPQKLRDRGIEFEKAKDFMADLERRKVACRAGAKKADPKKIARKVPC